MKTNTDIKPGLFCRCLVAVGVCAVFIHAVEGRAQAELSDVMNGLITLADEYEIDTDLIRAPTADEWNMFWRAVNSALQSDSLEDLAALAPYAQTALSYLDHVPEAKPYADWLRQRMDYIMVADDVIKEDVVTPPTRKPEPPSSRKPATIIPPPPVSGPPVAEKPPVSSSSSSVRKSMDVDRWMKKLEGRPAPKQSGRYVPMLKPVFTREGVPEQLVWLAEVESSFDPQAKSPVGALGLYQFMPATAERFGLSLRPEDERIIPERSATAAAKYLKFLHGRFGSWPLALAAYNAGEGRVGKLLTRHKGTSFEDIADHLPAETRMYVPKIDAVMRIREGVSLISL